MKECLVLTRRDRLPPSEEKAECGGGQRVGDEETLGDSPGVRQGGLAGRRVHVRPLSTRLGCPGDGTTGAFLCQDPGLDPGEDPGEDPGLGPGVGPRADPGADPGAGPGAGGPGQPGLEAPPSAATRGPSPAAQGLVQVPRQPAPVSGAAWKAITPGASTDQTLKGL